MAKYCSPARILSIMAGDRYIGVQEPFPSMLLEVEVLENQAYAMTNIITQSNHIRILTKASTDFLLAALNVPTSRLLLFLPILDEGNGPIHSSSLLLNLKL